MIQDFIDRFEKNKEAIRAEFSTHHPGSYTDIVKIVVKHIAGDDYERMDVDRITLIDHGAYQGTLVFVIGATGYQPDTYWYVKVGYGSCSGCDTLESIRRYDDDTPTDAQQRDYMTLALHIVQGLKKMGDE